MKTNTLCQNCNTREKSIFCDLSHEHLKEMDSVKTTNTYKAHQAIFYEGNRPYGLYCVSSGKVKLYKMDADGNQKIVRIAGPGDILGYRCLLSDEPYTATAETIEEAKICFVDKTTFTDIIEADPKTTHNLLKTLSIELRQAEQESFNVVHKSVRERVAELLLIFNKRFGQKVKDGFLLDISLSRQELADCVGTTQESVIRTLSDFKKEELISESGKQIIITDVENLIDAANLPE
ncbi:Crp/Fnr family transcriptional regulator [bacterium]|nr:Crp/Fnr family transcriptional regulator [bacterium]